MTRSNSEHISSNITHVAQAHRLTPFDVQLSIRHSYWLYFIQTPFSFFFVSAVNHHIPNIMTTDRTSYVSYTDSGNTSRAASTYSIRSSSPSSYAVYDETKPLLQPAFRSEQSANASDRNPPSANATASSLSSVINLSNTILGTGMLAMVSPPRSPLCHSSLD